MLQNINNDRVRLSILHRVGSAIKISITKDGPLCFKGSSYEEVLGILVHPGISSRSIWC